MARVMIDCPETRKPIYTGNDLNWFDLDALPLEERRVRCPWCGHWHPWTRNEAYLVADGGES